MFKFSRVHKFNFHKFASSINFKSIRSAHSFGSKFINRISTKPSVFFISSGLTFLTYCYTEFKTINNDVSLLISVDEIMKHNKSDDCWVVINDNVFDVTRFLTSHPGGRERIMKYAGKDASSEFSKIHSSEVLDRMVNHIDHLGILVGEFEHEFDAETFRIKENMKNKPNLNTIINLSDFEYVAKHVLPQSSYCYFATGATDEFSIRENSNAYSRVFFKPRVLQEIGQPDLSTVMLGNKVDIPIYITAFAGSKFSHPLGERNLQQTAYKANIMQMIPKLLSFPFDEFFSEVPKDQKLWYQLHFDTQDELDNVHKTIKKVEQVGHFKGFFINVDLADLGNRERDSKNRLEDEEAANCLAAAANNGKVKYPKRFCWKEIDYIRTLTNLPISLKGVQCGEDVVIAAEKGINGVILSNHGGRQLDFSRSPLEVLAESKKMLKERGLEDKIEIFIDGGIRRGSDIIKALCLGAKGVGLGRPFIYAMAGYGEEGTTKVVEILANEMKNNMKLLGVDKIEDLNESLIDISNLNCRNSNMAYEKLNPPRFKNKIVESE